MTHMARHIFTDQRNTLLLLRIAIALAAYHQHQSVEDDDFAQAARLLARHRDLVVPDVQALIA
jgi:hypothetical protein